MLINPENEEIISLAFEKGKVHDFQLFKSSKIHLKPGAQLTADIKVLQNCTRIPFCRKSLAKIDPYRRKTENRTEISLKNVSLLNM
jgi:hypothetical protein